MQSIQRHWRTDLPSYLTTASVSLLFSLMSSRWRCMISDGSLGPALMYDCFCNTMQDEAKTHSRY